MRRAPHAWGMITILAAFLTTALFAAGPLFAAGKELSTGDVVQTAPRLALSIGKSIILKSATDIGRVSVAQPEIADFVLLSPRQVYITGRAPGLTNLTIWDKNDKIRNIYDVDVAPDITRLKRMLHDILPDEKSIEIMATQDSITLTGSISSPENLKKAASLAEVYAPGKVINLLQVGGVQQIMLEVRVAEMSNSLIKRMNINFNAVWEGDFVYSMLGGATSIAPAMLDILGPEVVYDYLDNTTINSGETTLASLDYFPKLQTSTSEWYPPTSRESVSMNSSPTTVARFNTDWGGLGNTTWTGFIDILKTNGLVKILAEPTLVCLNGQTAKFLAGGEIPVPVPSGLGTVGIEWKEFGVRLQFIPTVLSQKRISLAVQPEVSELDETRGIEFSGFFIPALSTRKASTTIELEDGQSFAIAGMLKQESRDAVDKYPTLGDIPVLGSLFKSSDFQKSETELVIIVTAHMAKPLDKDKIKLPTDNYEDPDDLFFYWNIKTDKKDKKDQEAGEQAAASAPQTGLSAGKAALDGEFGQIMPKPLLTRDLAN